MKPSKHPSLAPPPPPLLLLLLLAHLAVFSFAKVQSQSLSQPQARPIQIKNESGKPTELYWIHPQSDELISMTPSGLVHGQTFALNSFVNHTFLVREAPDERTGGCGSDYGTGYEAPSLSPVCRSVYVTVNDRDDQVIHILKDMEIEVEDSDSDSDNNSNNSDSNNSNSNNSNSQVPEAETASTSSLEVVLSDCHQRALRTLSATQDVLRAIDDYTRCARPSLTSTIESLHSQIRDQQDLRLSLAEPYEDYTCADFDLPTTPPRSTHTYLDRDGLPHAVGVLLDRDDAKIHYLSDFISPDECAAIEAAAAPTLHQATVADGAGGSHLQKSRKALQAGVRVPWERERDDDPIARVARRLYDYVNHATGYDIQTPGQEDLMSIQYTGRGLDDPAPDRYKPHCDGQCDGLAFQNAGRVATVVMYCEAPEKGGATNFRNVGVHVVPKKGDAAFFSYLGSDGRVDDRMTEHSCCPVLVGEKKIAVQWLRLGVDEENPWNSFNTLNVKIGSEEE